MEFVRGNRAIRDHALDGKDLHLFQSLSKGEGYRYLGRFTCPTWQFREGVVVMGRLGRSSSSISFSRKKMTNPLLLPRVQQRSVSLGIVP